MRKKISNILILFVGLPAGLLVGYFLIFGVGKSFEIVTAYTGDIDFSFLSNPVAQGGPDAPKSFFNKRSGKDVYFLDYQKTYKISDKAPVPNVTSESFIVGDIESGEIILAKNEDKPLAIASLSKLMTAVIADEKFGLSSDVYVSEKAISTYGKQGSLSKGENYQVKDILFPLLLESSNDAAEAIAESYGRASFMNEMNDKAREIKMYNTHFGDPSGLSSLNISSSHDLFSLSLYIEKYRSFIFDTTRIKRKEIDDKVWFNNSKFRSDDDYVGGKNGYTDIAWKTQMAIFEIPFEEETKKIIFIILKTDDVEGDVYGLKKYVEKYVTFE